MQFRPNLLAIGIVLLANSTAVAQSENAYDADQIVVTGARAPLQINQLGSAITVITRQEIEQRQSRYVTDLLRIVPGFAVSHTGVTGSQTQVRVRGGEANHVLVLIDGVRANDPATGDEFRWEYLTTNNIERIEIVRGTQSSLWGSDAIAAVVHVISRSGQSGSGFDGFVESGSFGTNNLGIGGTVDGDNWSLSTGLDYLDTDGSNISRTGNEKDGSDVTTLAVNAKTSISDSLDIDLSVRFNDAYSQFDPVDFFVTGLPVDGDVATESENLYGRASATFKPADSKVTHRISVGLADTDVQNLVDGRNDSSNGSKRLTFAYQADVNIGENILSMALEHEQTDFSQRGAIVFGDPNQDQEIDITSVIADFQGLAHERLTWLLSARFDDNSDFDNAVTGRLSLAYAWSDSTTLRSNIGIGRKNPTMTELFGFFPGQFVGNSDLEPEQSTSYDIGVDMDFAGGAVTVQASLFAQDIKDEIDGFVFDPVTFLSTAENRDGKSERRGAELGLRWQLSDTIGFNASYTYLDATEPDFSGEQVAEVRRPRHAGAIAFDYRSSNERVSAALNADYGGTRTDVFFPPFPDPSQTVTLSSYWLVDLTVQYQLTSSTSVYARGMNLLDEDYEQVYGYQTPARAGYLGLRTKFGH